MQASIERFIDIQTYSDDQIARLVKELEIDIVIDLMGYTTDLRTGVLARRVAPIQVNYFGYSGTMGAGYIDYLIGDKTIIPQHQRKFYSENIVFLPNSFLPPDHKRQISDKSFSRAEASLPDNGFVFCSFNNHYKITPGVFDSVDAHIDPGGRKRALASRAQFDGRKQSAKGSGCARVVNPERLGFAGANAARRPPGKASSG